MSDVASCHVPGVMPHVLNDSDSCSWLQAAESCPVTEPSEKAVSAVWRAAAKKCKEVWVMEKGEAQEVAMFAMLFALERSRKGGVYGHTPHPLSDGMRSILSAALEGIEGSGREVGAALVAVDRGGDKGVSRPPCVVRRNPAVHSILKAQGGGPRRPGLTVRWDPEMVRWQGE